MMRDRTKLFIVSALALTTPSHMAFAQSATAPCGKTELQAVGEQIEDSWSVPFGKEGEVCKKDVFHVRVTFTESRAAQSAEILDPVSGDPLCAETREALNRAVRISSPLHLPSCKLPHSIEFRFDLKGLE
ncbi:MAG TPA: hypothetical protein VGM59_11055 [Dongiaceae bacterium]|jgi:hypothetical protein